MASRKDDIPRLDLDSPRIIAAMKVTGIEFSEIAEAKSSEVDDEGAQDSLRSRTPLMERKRRQLLREVEDTAAALDESVVDAILSPSPVEAQSARSLAEHEKRKIDDRRQRAKAEMQRELQREIEKKQAYESSQREKMDSKKRTKEKNDDKDAILAKRYEEVARRHDKQEEMLNRLKKDANEQRKETVRKLEEGNQRVGKQAEERKQAWATLSEDRSRKMAELVQRNMDHKRVETENQMKRAAASLAKQREREERMQKQASEALQTKRSKFADRMTAVSKTMNDQQAERERQFKENTERLERARQAGRDLHAELSERVRSTREKETEKWMNNREQQKKDNRAHVQKLRAEINDGHQKSVEVREKFLQETVYHYAKTKGCMEEIVQQNKARLSRSGECQREQTLAKIRLTKDKLESRVDQRREVSKYRTDAIRDELVGRTQLSEVKYELMNDASNKRINQLLKEIGMPLLSNEHAKEEGDDDKKQ